ncbi:MAG: family 20 glycosylhydrolase [Bacteroidetes bacterium]|nr:family 20 glycosylhydrolase [Bacteroidota bacterium]
MRKKLLLPMVVVFLSATLIHAQDKLDSLLPVRGLCINVPRPAQLDSFVTFIDKELSVRKVNTLILSVEYSYQFKSHPELIDSFALSTAEVKKIVSVCKKHHIRIVPQINFLGHQSWANRTGKLLKQYPQFDETPWIQMPEKYEWPNADKLYCKSYCPLHPDLHKVIFDVMDELVDVFEADVFHAGMDEVFFLGEDKCPRCGGRDPSELFADEVRRIQDHLALKRKELWIWGDRLIDGKTSGLGEWEASYNNSYRAVDLIPKDVVICDWHYERADKTAIYFAMKGFRVMTCPWRDVNVSLAQINDMVDFRKTATPEMRDRLLGIIETTWSNTGNFLRSFYNNQPKPNERSSWYCFRMMYDAIGKL